MDYDVIVIGGGIGGASLGAILATAGKKVLVLEREKVLAGRMTDISFKGHTINAGGHFLGEPDDIIGKIYEYAGIKLEYTSEIGESPIYRDGKWSLAREFFKMDKEEYKKVIRAIKHHLKSWPVMMMCRCGHGCRNIPGTPVRLPCLKIFAGVNS